MAPIFERPIKYQISGVFMDSELQLVCEVLHSIFGSDSVERERVEEIEWW